MKQLRILLVCGSGASSGFMAANIRKAAAARGMDAKVVARGEAEIENYVDEIDVLIERAKKSLDEAYKIVRDEGLWVEG